MCSPAGSVDPDVLVAKDAMRKQVMKKTLQVSTILNCVFRIRVSVVHLVTLYELSISGAVAHAHWARIVCRCCPVWLIDWMISAMY